MTIEQERIRQKQLNAQLNLKRHEESRIKFEVKKRQLEMECAGFLPDIYRPQFEERYFSGTRLKRVLKNKNLSHWRAAQKIILEIQLEPSDWFDGSHRFYDWFHRRKYSYSYTTKIIGILNLWGFFLSRKQGRPFFSIPKPRGVEKHRLLDAYFRKRGVPCNQSEPITPAQLESAKSQISAEQYNWLYLFVWFGLRPAEIDRIKNPENVRIMGNLGNPPVLWIYQEKLVSAPSRYRWKLLPVFLPEQQQALAFIECAQFKRPLVKTVKRHFGSSTTLYGGRKGFTDLMMSLGQDFANISQWMGHSSMQRTWRSYKCRTLVHFNEGRVA